MKRFFFTVIALSAVAVGCTKSGLLESPQTYEAPISFEPYTGKALATKATVVETSDIETAGFQVIGFLEGIDNTLTDPNASTTIDPTNWHSVNNLVTKPSGSEKWTYGDTPAYWPDGLDLTFVAWGNNATVTNPVGDNYTKITYNVPPAVANQKDLIISPVMQNKNGKQQGPVSVKLYHALSRIGFSVKTEGNANTTGTHVTIKNISITGAFSQSATFDLSKITAPSGDVKTLTYTTENYTPATPQTTTYSLLTSDYTTSNKTGVVDSNNQYIKTYPIYNGDVDDNRFMMILPGQVGSVIDIEDINDNGNNEDTVSPYIKVVYQLPDAAEETVFISLVDANGNWNFMPGKAYEFVFTVSTVAVGFNVEVNIWEPTNGDAENPQTVPIPMPLS